VRLRGGQVFEGVSGRGVVLLAGLLCMLLAAPAGAQLLMKELPEPAQGVDLVQRIGEQLPLDVEFTDSYGETVAIGRYFNQGKPVVLVMVYYNCPLICPLTLERLQETLNALSYTVGDEFNVAVVSFDTRNTTAMAAQNKAGYLSGYNRPRTESVLAGWEFHTSTRESARRLAEAIGFQYRFIPETGEFSHPSTFVILTSDGRISRYISGLETDSREMRMALLEAAEGKIALSISDFFLHLCFRWDPSRGKYSLHAMRVMQVVGLLSVVGLVTLVAALKAGERARAWRRAAERNRRRETGQGVAEAGREQSPAAEHMEQTR
jgi:protein SCO1